MKSKQQKTNGDETAVNKVRAQVYRLRGVQSGEINVDPPLHPTADGQKAVIVSSVQKTVIGPGVAHVALADNPQGRTYPISARHLPEEALQPFLLRK